MFKKTVLSWSVAAVCLTGMAFAQESATLTLKSGEKISAQLMDLGGSGYTVQVNGQERQIKADDVAAIDFSGGTISNADWDKLSGGKQVLFLKNGETVTGELVDIGGSSPLRMTFRTSAGDHDYNSNEIARIVMARPANTNAAVATTGSANGQGVTVSAQRQWTPTGLSVRQGEWVTFNGTGDIHIGGEGNPSTGVAGVSATTLAPGSPVPGSPAGALIGRIGNGAAFLIGSQTRVQMPATGQLFLGVNDGHVQDNDGSFQVQVAHESGGVRRR
jgi:hypothetical protein